MSPPLRLTAGASTLLVVLLASTNAVAQVERASAHRWPQLLDPLQSAADAWYLRDLDANPASLGIFRGWELDFLHTTAARDRSAALPGLDGQRILLGGALLGSGRGVGLSLSGRFEHLYDPVGDGAHMWVGGIGTALSFGRVASLGLTWRWIRGDAWDQREDGSLGLALRPTRWMSLGAAIHHLNRPLWAGQVLDRTARVGVAFRPVATPLLSFGADWEGFLADGDTRQLLARIRVAPVDGLAITAGFTAAREGDDWAYGGAASVSFMPGIRMGRIHGGAFFDESGYGGFQAGLSLRTTEEPTVTTPSRRIFVDVAITGGLPDQPREVLFQPRSPSLLDLRLQLRRIARDRTIGGILLKITSFSGGFTQAQEIARSIADLRSHGKKVYVYLEDARNQAVYIAAHGDHVILNPATLVQMIGLHLVRRFYVDTLDMLGVSAQVIRFEEYKSAADGYVQRESREVMREVEARRMDAVYEQFTGDIAAMRARTVGEVRGWVDLAPMAPEKAREIGLVDAVGGREDLYDLVRAREGRHIRFTKKNPAMPSQDLRWGRNPRVAVISLEGFMVTGVSKTIPLIGMRFSGAETVGAALDQAAADPRVDGILFRVQSPGGLALAAEILNRKVRAAATKKPLVVSIGSYAASGGYYAAAPAPRIFILPGSITGSIGVVYGKPVISGLLDLLKIRREHSVRGAHADMESLDRRLSDGELSHIREQLGALYQLFMDRVAEGRKMTPERVHELARGRVWLGSEALENGLADQDGGILEALDYLLGQIGGQHPYPPELVYLPGTSFMGALLGGVGLATASTGPEASLGEVRDLLLLLARPATWMVDGELWEAELLDING
ncbi:MAG: S49 family peptidase [Pseudomonadota bacterium]